MAVQLDALAYAHVALFVHRETCLLEGVNASGYLQRVADQAVLRDSEKESVELSLAALRTRLRSYFGDGRTTNNPVKEHFAFGSYTRGTILPRAMDPQSDIDYMVVFRDSDAKPQAYLDRLMRFVESAYPRSEVAQSSPTIVLSLNHIQFELVPATAGFWGLKIPGRGSLFNDWIDTTPNEFNAKLTDRNKNNQNLIKPLVRLAKYWNARNRYPFESFRLEEKVVGHSSLSEILFGGDLFTRFHSFMSELSVPWDEAAWKRESITRAREIVTEVREFTERGDHQRAESRLQRLLPPLG